MPAAEVERFWTTRGGPIEAARRAAATEMELGLGHFEGRSWTGLHRHALMTCIAFAYLQHLRLEAIRRRGKRWRPPPQPAEGHHRSRACPPSAAPSSAGCPRISSRQSDVRTAGTGSDHRPILKCPGSAIAGAAKDVSQSDS